MSEMFPKLSQQRAALTRALKSKDKNKVLTETKKAIADWNKIGAWPDDWSRWQRALNDVFPFGEAPDMDRL